MKRELYTEEQAFALEKRAKWWIAFCVALLLLVLGGSIPLCFGVDSGNGLARGFAFGAIWVIGGLVDLYAFFEGIRGNIEKGRFILRCATKEKEFAFGAIDLKEDTITVGRGIVLHKAEIKGKEGTHMVLIDPSRALSIQEKAHYRFAIVEGIVVMMEEAE